MSVNLIQLFEKKVSKRVDSLSFDQLKEFAKTAEINNFNLRAEIERIKLVNEQLQQQILDNEAILVKYSTKFKRKPQKQSSTGDLLESNRTEIETVRLRNEEIDELKLQIDSLNTKITEKESIIRLLQQETAGDFRPELDTVKKERSTLEDRLLEALSTISDCFGLEVETDSLRTSEYLSKVVKKIQRRLSKTSVAIEEALLQFESQQKRRFSKIESTLSSLNKRLNSLRV